MNQNKLWKAAGAVGLMGLLAWNEFRRFKKELEKSSLSERNAELKTEDEEDDSNRDS
ncbi:hypothetical protein J9317_08390 [Metabacillus sp. KIGAM252]|uniref:DUF3918 domain-containing protein n=1 Tax=Metabacillus flavus TaxID=2823519 RepID=A0ABS5LDF1_9BACI|nr:hypothetical protein [Metabacillus flavus]MBS2968773.1 hypothetical protein [Metabacillus flavus]